MASQIVAQAALFVGLDDASVMDQVEIGIEDPQPDFGAVEKAVVNARENGAKLHQIGVSLNLIRTSLSSPSWQGPS